MAIPRIHPYSFAKVDMIPVNRADWTVSSQRAVLLIHDMQNYFIDFYDRQCEPVPSLLKNIQQLKISCKQLGIPVVYTAQPGDQSVQDRALLTDFWGAGLSGDEKIQAITTELEPQSDDLQFTKWRYSAFQRTPLRDFMQEQKRDQLIICGVYAHIGILATSLEAFMQDIQAVVVADAVADFSADDQSMALTYVAQRCGYVSSLRAIQNMLESGAGYRNELSIDMMKQQVADCLNVPVQEISVQDNLMYLGLDSIRLMNLIETWRDMGAQVSFADLAEATSIAAWWAMISESMQTMQSPISRPEIIETLANE